MKICKSFLHLVSGFLFACGLFLVSGKFANFVPLAFGQSRGLIGAANPMFLLFQVLFVLFIISPPIIAIMLFLIWVELREKNKLK